MCHGEGLISGPSLLEKGFGGHYLIILVKLYRDNEGILFVFFLTLN